MKLRLKISIFGILMLLILLFGDNRKYAIIAFCAAIVHEVGHICASLILKMKLEGLTLNLFGARLKVALTMYSYKQEFWMALAGPLANAIFGTLSIFIYTADDTQPNTYLLFFAIASFFLASLNLLPIKGFDGGRIFICAMAPRFGVYMPENWLDKLSFSFIFLLWVISIYLMLRIGSSLTLFVFSSALLPIE